MRSGLGPVPRERVHGITRQVGVRRHGKGAKAGQAAAQGAAHRRRPGRTRPGTVPGRRSGRQPVAERTPPATQRAAREGGQLPGGAVEQKPGLDGSAGIARDRVPAQRTLAASSRSARARRRPGQCVRGAARSPGRLGEGQRELWGCWGLPAAGAAPAVSGPRVAPLRLPPRPREMPNRIRRSPSCNRSSRSVVSFASTPHVRAITRTMQ